MDDAGAASELGEVGAGSGEVGVTETPDFAAGGSKEEPLLAEREEESPGALEAEAGEAVASKDLEGPQAAEDLEAEAVPAPAAAGSAAEIGDVPGASPVSELPGRRLRKTTSDESQSDRPPRKQSKSGREPAEPSHRGATRQLKVNVSNESDLETPPKKLAKRQEQIRVAGVARPFRRRTTSAASVRGKSKTDAPQLDNRISKKKAAMLATPGANDSLGGPAIKTLEHEEKMAPRIPCQEYAEAAGLQTELATVRLEEERQKR